MGEGQGLIDTYYMFVDTMISFHWQRSDNIPDCYIPHICYLCRSNLRVQGDLGEGQELGKGQGQIDTYYMFVDRVISFH